MRPVVIYRSFLTDLEATVTFEFYPFANVFRPSPPPSSALTARLCPQARRHAVVGRRFYGYYDVCCRPLFHNDALLRRLGLKPSWSRRRQRPRYSGHSPGKSCQLFRRLPTFITLQGYGGNLGLQ